MKNKTFMAPYNLRMLCIFANFFIFFCEYPIAKPVVKMLALENFSLYGKSFLFLVKFI